MYTISAHDNVIYFIEAKKKKKEYFLTIEDFIIETLLFISNNEMTVPFILNLKSWKE